MRKLTVVSIHNFYRQPGGEDEVYKAEAELLARNGHCVVRHEYRNDQISFGWIDGIRATWNPTAYSALLKLIEFRKPDLIHFHNTFPVVSPAALYCASRRGIPIVHELQNFRLLCPSGTLSRNGNVCVECLSSRTLAPALKHRCYRGSLAATAALTSMLHFHRIIGTWNRLVKAFIAPSEFVRQMFIRHGLRENRIFVKPNPISSSTEVGNGEGGYALFVGRLSEEKGVGTLANAWRDLPTVPLVIAGTGSAALKWPSNVTCVGLQNRASVIDLMRRASFLIVPSIWYETGPLTLLEAFECGTPVIASDIGSMAERVTDHHNGLLFRAGDPEDLARKVRWAVENPERMREMRVAARREYETKYTPEINYKRLMEIYEMAIENSHRA